MRMGCELVRGVQLDVDRPLEDLCEPERRHRRRALEREHMCLWIGGDHEIVHTEQRHQRLLRERCVVIVIDEQVVEEWST